MVPGHGTATGEHGFQRQNWPCDVSNFIIWAREIKATIFTKQKFKSQKLAPNFIPATFGSPPDNKVPKQPAQTVPHQQIPKRGTSFSAADEQDDSPQLFDKDNEHNNGVLHTTGIVITLSPAQRSRRRRRPCCCGLEFYNSRRANLRWGVLRTGEHSFPTAFPSASFVGFSRRRRRWWCDDMPRSSYIWNYFYKGSGERGFWNEDSFWRCDCKILRMPQI